jgi:ribonucleoside-diphosphate reductase alpha chain
MQIAPISQQIWDMKYRLKGPGGEAVDKTIEESWQRVAAALAEAEPRDRDVWRDRFAEALSDFRFLPAGRILSGAGTDRKVTLFNCFVMGDIPDDMAGIFEQLKEAAVTMQQGGGIGYDFSTLRPKGAPVKGVGADASGPLSFMDVWDAMCRTIMSAGSRRGAMMAVMSCAHPDIEAFIEAKREAGRLRMFNLSVLISDAFMAAVKKDESWTLSFNGTHYKTLQARELWDKIMRATYAFAEPGVIFIDRINRLNNLHYCETIHATNPCIPSDSWIHTSKGPRRVADLLGRPFTALVNGEAHQSDPRGFFATGHKPVLALSTKEGYRLRLTGDHPVRKVIRLTRENLDWEWCAAGRLTPGDRILLNDHRRHADWEDGVGTESEGYLLGLLIGDGTLKQDDAILSVWKPALAVNGSAATGVDGVMEAVLEAVQKLPRRADFRGWIPVTGRQEWRLKLRAVHGLASRYGLAPGKKTITPAIEAESAGFYRGLLRGLFDTDGSIQGTHGKGISVRLAQSDEELLRSVQRMLLRLGIVSTLYLDRRPAMARPLPDGRGGLELYECAAQHELVIAGANLIEFQARIGFADHDKAARLEASLRGYRRALNRERFTATIESLTPDGDEAVFDASIPGLNAFDANGLVVHNCGEQPLPPYGVCLLGSVNLARLVKKPFTGDATLDETELSGLVTTAVRMLDNVIDVSNYPLEQHRREAYTKRRIGLGVTGLADALIQCGVRYGSQDAVKLTHRWLAALRRAAYLASAALAEEKGPFPLYDAEQYLAGETIRSLEPEVQDAIRKHGIRNALVTSIAPTGTISLFADNVSSGLEPVFSFAYSRNILMPDGTRKQEEVSDYALRLFRQVKGESAPLPDYFVDAQSLSPADHVVMQATVQTYIDSSISKTINVPEEIDFDAFKDVYLQAYEQGCKGCTTYRPNDVTGAVLEVKKEAPAAQTELPLPTMASTRPRDSFDAGAVVHLTQPLNRPEELPGATYKVRWPDSDHAMYITLNDIVQDGRRRPFEVFINSKNMDHFAWTVALTRMISAVFRRGGDVAFVVEELKAVFDPRGGQWMGGRYVPSLLAAIGDVIERHMISIGFIPDPTAEREGLLGRLAVNSAPPAGLGGTGMGALRQCPKCAQPSLVRQEGCDTCTSCGYSKCG